MLTFLQNRATSPCTDISHLCGLTHGKPTSATRITTREGRPDKDAPLKEDIRLLGRLLGDVLRDQEGEEVYAVVETIRQTACASAARPTPAPPRNWTAC
jgi:hypothetical protein